jgi:LacI family transcriptional regulator
LIIQGVSSACNAVNHSAMLWLAEPDYERRMIRQLLNKHVMDGMIIASTLIDDPLLKSLSEGDLPFMLIGRYPENGDVSYVDVDNEQAAFDLVSYMIRVGYRRIATITGPLNMIAGFHRLMGYKMAIREHDLPVDDRLIIETDFSESGGYCAMQKLLSLKPDAVFVASDTMALGALRAVKEAGLRIPDDIGIAGFDDMPFAETCDPPLTTVRQPIIRCGSVAVQALNDMIDHPSATHHHIILPTELVIRASCGSPI